MCGGGLRIRMKESSPFFTRATSISESATCFVSTLPQMIIARVCRLGLKPMGRKVGEQEPLRRHDHLLAHRRSRLRELRELREPSLYSEASMLPRNTAPARNSRLES